MGGKKATSAAKVAVISKYSRSPADTGSPEVQVALLTKRINELAQHFEKNPKDHHSRTGLLVMVGQRKRLLSYLRGRSTDRYKALIAGLELRR